MQRKISDDAIRDSVASLRMADGILRDLVAAGAIDDVVNDLPTLLAVACDEIARLESLALLIETAMDDPASSTRHAASRPRPRIDRLRRRAS
jgi:hypothetical protein